MSLAAKTPMNIALMLESDVPGGAEIMILQLAEELRRNGHRPFYVGPENGSGWLRDRFGESGFDCETFSLRRPVDWRCVRGLVRMLRRQQVDIVHSHEFTMSIYGAAAARVIRKPHIITHHSNMYFSKKWRRRAAMRWACRNSHSVVAVSDVTRLELEGGLGLRPGAVGVVYNGVDHTSGARAVVRKEVDALPDELLVVALGTVEIRKGHILLLQALSHIQERHPTLSWRVVIAGDDLGEANNLRAFASEHGFADRLHLLGYRSDIANILAAADLFVMPSIHEGLPMALLEAMIAGLPVVASRAGGMAEAITNDDEGILVSVGDVQELTAALQRAMTVPGEREALSRGARRRAMSAFTLQAMTSVYEELYLSAGNGTPDLEASSYRSQQH